jgi:hypothetical protein
MLCTARICACSEVHTKHTNMLCGQNVEFLKAKINLTPTNTPVLITV